ncbi:LexA family protein [Acidithiobacillus acidisediminis]|uniref:LexA family protein n=1 Tax=Acidithiobacillus acidisediminis TaxID=2937799 RepID=UPI00200C8F3A|nr:S24 family peptidase [Acidithiobacillus sp. S30A2]
MQDDIYRQRQEMLSEYIELEAQIGGARGALRRVADVLDIDRSLLSQIKSGHRNCGEELALKIGLKLRNPNWWVRDKDKKPGFDKNVSPAPSAIRTVPLISKVAAGRMTEVADPYEAGASEEDIPVYGEVSDYTFALRIEGNSMEPEFIDGDIVIIDPSVSPLPGDFVVAKNNEEEATFKKYRPRGKNDQGIDYFELIPLNEDYAPLRSDLEHLRVIGTMVMCIKKRRTRR